MRKAFEDFLFAKGLFAGVGEQEHAPEALAALAKKFNIRIVSNPGWATINMSIIAARNLGVNVPAPFYQGFPDSVLHMPLEAQIADRLLHYALTYGLGDFSKAGHSLFEDEVISKCFDEDAEVREFSIVSEKEAAALLADIVKSLLASSRPLSDAHYGLVLAYVQDFDYEVVACNCKDTVARLLLDTRDTSLARLLKLSDVIRLVEQLQFHDYGSKDVKKLNLRNRDRVFLSRVLDRIFLEGECDVRTCLEKRKLWKGLLNHLHYKPVNLDSIVFLNYVRNDDGRSTYSYFEEAMAAGDVREALAVLREQKGAGAVLRNLDYLLSRCEFPAAVDYVLDSIDTSNKVLLIQLFLHYCTMNLGTPRVFKFQKHGLTRVHMETGDEQVRRKTILEDSVVGRARVRMREALERTCKGTLGKVYIDEGMRRIALPLQEGASQGGVGTLTRGSRIPIPEGKKIRAFTYWERVDDIDLSAFVLLEGGGQVEFSWRSVSNYKSIVYSGDQTSGYHGGSEYFDIDFDLFKEEFPDDARYIVLCDNVFSQVPFSECLCKAGFMLRDREHSGEVFEPKTVESSFAITCPSTFAYLFGLDMKKREFVWLNMARDSRARVAGQTSMAFLLDYLEVTHYINLDDFARMLATEVVLDPSEADVVFSDKPEPLREGAELIRSRDVERIIALLN